MGVVSALKGTIFGILRPLLPRNLLFLSPLCIYVVSKKILIVIHISVFPKAHFVYPSKLCKLVSFNLKNKTLYS